MSQSEMNLIDFSTELDSSPFIKSKNTISFSNLLNGERKKVKENLLLDISNQESVIKNDLLDPFDMVLKDIHIQKKCLEKSKTLNGCNCDELLCLLDANDKNDENNKENMSSVNKSNCDFNLISSTSIKTNSNKTLNLINNCIENGYSKENNELHNLDKLDNHVNEEIFLNKSTVTKEESSINKNNKAFAIFDSLKCLDESYEDLMSIKPKWIDCELDIESDLEMLKIPILDKLNCEMNTSPVLEDTILSNTSETVTPENPIIKQDDTNTNKVSNTLAELKEKLKLQKLATDKKDINELIAKLKQIILECSDKEKIKAANDLLESLESLLNNNENIENQHKIITPKSSKLEMDENSPDINKSKYNENSIIENQENNDNNDDSGSNNIVIMKSPPQNIIKEIDKLLGNENILSKLNDKTSNNRRKSSTYIFVMKTPKHLIRQQSEIYDNKRITMNNKEDDDDDDKNKSFRRRSSSLTSIVQNKSNLKPKNLDFKTPHHPISQISNLRKSTNTISRNLDTKRKLLHDKEDIKESSSSLTLKTKTLSRRSLNTIHSIDKTIKNNTNPPKLRIKSNEVNSRKKGPLKATVPMIKVEFPLVNNSSSPTSGNTPLLNENNENSKSCTSTPNVTPILQKQKRISSINSNASTGAISKRHSINGSSESPEIKSKTNNRNSYLSVPSNSKSIYQRRSLSHLNNKLSKPEASNTNSNFETSKTQIKSIKTQDFSKTANKLAPTKVVSNLFCFHSKEKIIF